MTLSNALPIQFWLDGEESFNDKSVYGISSICFCQPWNCDDEINLQFLSDDDFDYSLNILDSSDNLLENLPFTQEQQHSEDYLSSYPLSGFTNEAGAGTNWTPGVNPSIVTAGVELLTDGLVESVTGIPAGQYILNIGLNFSGAGVSLAVNFYTNGVGIASRLFTSDGLDISVAITLPSAPDTIKFFVSSSTVSTRTTTLYTFSMTRNGYYYSLAFTPTAHCNEQVKFQIQNDSSSPNTIEASSDCVLLKESHLGTIAIDYSNNSNFNNLIYENISPSTTFRLRIPAIFFDEDNPAEQEDHELSNGEIVRLYNKLELKKRLDIGFMPAYMHQKLQLVLMHDNITIEERQWIRRDAYEKKEGHRMFPLRRASVWLHDKDFIKENQL
jgi:hypothetical protein